MWNEIKSNLLSSSVYLKEFLLFNLLVVSVIFFMVNDFFIIVTLIFMLLLLSLFYLNLIGMKRKKEMEQIRLIIHNIRKNYFTDADEITLSRHMKSLQQEIKLMFEKAKKDIEYLHKLQKVRSQFLGNVSHELRTPIFAIQGYIETLLDGAVNDERVNKNFLEKAHHHILNLSNLLNDLIDISMIESGEMRLSFRYFNVNEYLAPIVNDFKPMAEDKNIQLSYIPARENLQLFGDKNKLKQVMSNLIQNAVKYTERGVVEVFVQEEERFGRIIVKDTGIGIAPEEINRIFERFYRVDKVRSRTVGGTGLGLAIAKHIIEAHNSEIEVQSQPGAGSSFSFRLKK